MVADQRGEPPRPLAAHLSRAHMRRRRGLHLHRARRPSGRRLRLAHLAHEPSDQVRIGKLQDHAVRDAAGHGQRHRSVAGNPHWQGPMARPRQLQLRPLVRHGASLHQVPDDADRLLERGHARRRLAENAPSAVAATNAQVHPSARHLVEHRQRRRGYTRLARRRVGDAGPQAHALGRLRHERQQDVRLAPEHVAVEEPAVGEAIRLCAASQLSRSLEVVLRLEREAEVHLRDP